MLYRRMKNLDRDLSILGFGCMRLPVLNDGSIDEPVATAMIRGAIDQGVNYIDTAYPYHNEESEPFLGQALQDGYRERVNLATKLPSWLVHSREDMDRYLDEQLERLQTDHIDCYLVHSLNRAYWEELVPLGLDEFLDDAIDDGRIGVAGFSFHDPSVDVFREIVDGYDWTFTQIQYNFMDEHYQAGTAGLQYAAEKELGVVVMEPIKGGMLATGIPAIRKIWARAPTQRTPAEWALRWVWNHPEVTVVLSGMSTPVQVRENLSAADRGLPNSLSEGELRLFDLVKYEYTKRVRVSCTGCKYCMPCPAGVNIPECFADYNAGTIYDDPGVAKINYTIATGAFFGGSPSCASQCTECGACEEQCPQGIPIRERLKDVVAYFGS
ncbi:aldo/keto reductase [Methanosphaerula subterraneus]|uniref:aldo/keto reductase n=1 Tax=Methanosphaerula subterraneus TaxID=3350244 RepID=UPI003F86D3CB